MTDDLVAFLKARLDEDEQAAKAAQDGQSGRWEVDDDYEELRGEGFVGQLVHGGLYVADIGDGPHRMGGLREVDARHIARWDPARALAEVQAKRRIIEAALFVGIVGGVAMDAEILEALALPYASHPDYRAEWSPDEEVRHG